MDYTSCNSLLFVIFLYLLISSLSTLRFGPRWAKVPWTFSASQPPLNPSRPCHVSHSHDASLRGVWTKGIPSRRVSIGYFRCTFQSFHCTLGVKNVALLSDKAAKIDMMHSLLPLHRKRLHCILDVSQISLRLTLLFLYGPLLIP